jgi:hypothetical protein
MLSVLDDFEIFVIQADAKWVSLSFLETIYHNFHASHASTVPFAGAPAIDCWLFPL